MNKVDHRGMEGSVNIRSTGDVKLMAQVDIESFCPVDLTDFPYDVQTCKIEFGSFFNAHAKRAEVYNPHHISDMSDKFHS